MNNIILNFNSFEDEFPEINREGLPVKMTKTTYY